MPSPVVDVSEIYRDLTGSGRLPWPLHLCLRVPRHQSPCPPERRPRERLAFPDLNTLAIRRAHHVQVRRSQKRTELTSCPNSRNHLTLWAIPERRRGSTIAVLILFQVGYT